MADELTFQESGNSRKEVVLQSGDSAFKLYYLLPNKTGEKRKSLGCESNKIMLLCCYINFQQLQIMWASVRFRRPLDKVKMRLKVLKGKY